MTSVVTTQPSEIIVQELAVLDARLDLATAFRRDIALKEQQKKEVYGVIAEALNGKGPAPSDILGFVESVSKGRVEIALVHLTGCRLRVDIEIALRQGEEVDLNPFPSFHLRDLPHFKAISNNKEFFWDFDDPDSSLKTIKALVREGTKITRQIIKPPIEK